MGLRGCFTQITKADCKGGFRHCERSEAIPMIKVALFEGLLRPPVEPEDSQ
jgi:hypothetical protein